MPPRNLSSSPRVLPPVAQKTPVLKPTTPARSSQVLQTGRAPAQLSLFLRPVVGAR